jgi:hypothetical protein
LAALDQFAFGLPLNVVSSTRDPIPLDSRAPHITISTVLTIDTYITLSIPLLSRFSRMFRHTTDTLPHCFLRSNYMSKAEGSLSRVAEWSRNFLSLLSLRIKSHASSHGHRERPGATPGLRSSGVFLDWSGLKWTALVGKGGQNILTGEFVLV